MTSKPEIFGLCSTRFVTFIEINPCQLILRFFFFIYRDSESSEHWLRDVCQTKKPVERNIIYMVVAILLHHHANKFVVDIALDALHEQCKIQPHLVRIK